MSVKFIKKRNFVLISKRWITLASRSTQNFLLQVNCPMLITVGKITWYTVCNLSVANHIVKLFARLPSAQR
jgi:hypothetical protein